MDPFELPVVGQAPAVRERKDAARNRARVLEAAEALFAERGVAGVTMDDIAAAAGVGKGTLYRRFQDKGGLAAALLDQRGSELQQRVLSGPPPLGPGASAAARLRAFVEEYLSFQDTHLDLVLLSETSAPGGRLHKPAYRFWRQHVVVLMREAGVPDPVVRADVILAALAAEEVRFWVRTEGRRLPELARSLGAVTEQLCRAPRP